MTNLVFVSGCSNFSLRKENPRHNPCDCIVIHYTAGSFTSTLNTFLNPSPPRVSAHLIIDRNGTIYELLPPNRVAWHAGLSKWRNRTHVNNFGYGIELVSENEGPEGGLSRYTFTDEQYQSVRLVLWGGEVNSNKSGLHIIPGIANEQGLTDLDLGQPDSEVLGHEHISSGRKIDPGPLFDWARIRSTVSLPTTSGSISKENSPETTRPEKTKIVTSSKGNIGRRFISRFRSIFRYFS